MPTEQVQQIVKHHRPALIIGSAVGLALITGFIGYELAATPAVPVVPKASASEIVNYIANKRGLAGLPDVQQKQFLDDWKRRLNDTAARDDLKACLKNLDEEKRRDFVNGLARQLKKAFWRTPSNLPGSRCRGKKANSAGKSWWKAAIRRCNSRTLRWR